MSRSLAVGAARRRRQLSLDDILYPDDGRMFSEEARARRAKRFSPGARRVRSFIDDIVYSEKWRKWSAERTYFECVSERYGAWLAREVGRSGTATLSQQTGVYASYHLERVAEFVVLDHLTKKYGDDIRRRLRPQTPPAYAALRKWDEEPVWVLYLGELLCITSEAEFERVRPILRKACATRLSEGGSASFNLRPV